MATDAKCGYCSPCFSLTNLIATVAFPGMDQEDRTRREGTEIWKLSYTLCLKDVKCINRLFTTRPGVTLNRGSDYTGPGFPFMVTNDEICITDHELSIYSPKVCCSIPPLPSPVFGEGKPIEFFEKDCCYLLKKAIQEDQGKYICKNGRTFFEVPAGVGGATSFDVQMQLIGLVRDLVQTQWNHFINDFSTDFGGDTLADFYNSAEWSRCLSCPEGCA
jgi:hypothetical protein